MKLFGVILVPEITSSYAVLILHQLFTSILLQLLYFWFRMHSPIPGWDLRPLFRPLKLCSLTLFGVILVPKIASSYTVWISQRLFASILLQLLYFWIRMLSPIQCWDSRPLFRPRFASFRSLRSCPPMQPGSCLKFWHAFCLHAVSTAAFCVSHAFPPTLLVLFLLQKGKVG